DVPRLAGVAHDRDGQRHEGRHAAAGVLMLFARLQPSRHEPPSRYRVAMRTSCYICAVILVLVGATAFAQGRFFRGRARDFKPQPYAPYDGRFNFVRVIYECDESGYWWRGLPSWAHGY